MINDLKCYRCGEWPCECADKCAILWGDCNKFIPIEVDSIVTDPPYGIQYDCNYLRFTNGKARQKKYSNIVGDETCFDPTPWMDFSNVIIWGANCFSNRLPKGSWLVWDKRHKNGTAFVSEAEVAWKKGGSATRIYSETCQGFVRKERTQHPTQKSIGVMQWCCEFTKGTILDPFMGSGTTLIAAKRLGRQCIGIEIEEKYCEIAANRLDSEPSPLFKEPLEVA